MWEVGKEYPTRNNGTAIFLGNLPRPSLKVNHAFAYRVRPDGDFNLYWYNPDGSYPSTAKEYRGYDVISEDPNEAEDAVLKKMRSCGIIRSDCSDREAVAILREIKAL